MTGRWMMHRLGMGLVVVGMGWCGAPVGEAKIAGSVLVEGKIADPHGAPVAGATVQAELSGAVFLAWLHGYWATGQHRTTTSGADGSYAVRLDIPEGVPRERLGVRVRAAKLGGPPYYYARIRGGSLHNTSGSARLEINLAIGPSLAHAAFLAGTVRDREDLTRLQGVHVLTTSDLALTITNADGDYFDVVPLESEAQSKTICVEPFFTQLEVVIPNGVAYAEQCQTVELQSGQSVTLDFSLARVEPQTEIVGRVTDRLTERPIPSVQVLMKALIPGPGASPRLVAVTDLFGRYHLSVPFMSFTGDWRVDALSVSTTGAFFFDGEREYSPYLTERLDVTGRLVNKDGTIRTGEIIQADFALQANPRPPPIDQWALSAEATSEYSSEWRVSDATGPNAEGACGAWVRRTAWCKRELSGNDAITLHYGQPVLPERIEVFLAGPPASTTYGIQEMYVSGDGKTWTQVWNGDFNPQCTWSLGLRLREAVGHIKIVPKPGSWGCVDAVKLVEQVE
jgi:hypothetical protein